jgi:hypothetical protein
MEVDILNYSSYNLMFDTDKKMIIGTQTIYSNELQGYLIRSFMDTDDINQMFTPSDYSEQMRSYCFNINNIILHPTITCNKCPKNYIFVSDEIYDQYFKNINTKLQLNFYYDLPKVKDVKLKRLSGNFPYDDSLEHLLTHYFESCMVINKGQQFIIDYGVDYIKFEVSQLTYITEPRRDIKDRFDEINITIKLNQFLTDNENAMLGLKECKSMVTNFMWYYHTLGKQDILYGDVSFQNINIDFEETKIEEPKPLKSKPPSIEDFKSIVEPEQQLTKEELRLKRLEFYNKKLSQSY